MNENKSNVTISIGEKMEDWSSPLIKKRNRVRNINHPRQTPQGEHRRNTELNPNRKQILKTIQRRNTDNQGFNTNIIHLMKAL